MLERLVRTLFRLLLIAVCATGIVVGTAANGLAQPHGGHGPGPHGHAAVVVAAPYYAPYWYDPWFAFSYQWGYPYPYPYPYHYHGDPDGSLKIEVKPAQAEVFVDGYYAGIVDDFDGAFQRLHVPPGEHEIILYLDGYRTVHQKVYVQIDSTFKLKYAMEKLGANEQPEPRPQPPNPPADQYDPQNPPPPQQPRAPYDPRAPRQPQAPNEPRQPREQRPPQPPPDQRAPNVYGTLAVRVQPAGADVIVDGEKWNGPDGQERVFIELPEGRHTVEIRKDGYRTYVTEIDIRRGDTTPLNVSMRTQEER